MYSHNDWEGIHLNWCCEWLVKVEMKWTSRENDGRVIWQSWGMLTDGRSFGRCDCSGSSVERPVRLDVVREEVGIVN